MLHERDIEGTNGKISGDAPHPWVLWKLTREEELGWGKNDAPETVEGRIVQEKKQARGLRPKRSMPWLLLGDGLGPKRHHGTFLGLGAYSYFLIVTRILQYSRHDILITMFSHLDTPEIADPPRAGQFLETESHSLENITFSMQTNQPTHSPCPRSPAS